MEISPAIGGCEGVEAHKPQVDTLLAAIDGRAAKDPGAVDKLKSAADHMPMTAFVLSGAIVKQLPDKVSS